MVSGRQGGGEFGGKVSWSRIPALEWQEQGNCYWSNDIAGGGKNSGNKPGLEEALGRVEVITKTIRSAY